MRDGVGANLKHARTVSAPDLNFAAEGIYITINIYSSIRNSGASYTCTLLKTVVDIYIRVPTFSKSSICYLLVMIAQTQIRFNNNNEEAHPVDAALKPDCYINFLKHDSFRVYTLLCHSICFSSNSQHYIIIPF